MRLAGAVLAAVGFAACLYFVVAFHFLTGGDWRRNSGGRHLMESTAALGVLLGLVVAARFWPDYPGRFTITLVVFAVMVGQLLWRIVLLHRAQRGDRESAGRR